MKGLITLLVALSYLAFQAVDAKKCRALAMSGGGDLGAYQAAVVMGLTNYLPEEELSWDVVTGVSAGSLNALGLAAYKPNEVLKAAEFIYALWNSIPDYQAYGNWPLGIVQGLFFKGGIFDLSPGKSWIREKWESRTVNRRVSFATVDSGRAIYTVYDYNGTGTLPADFIDSAFASASIPFIFPPTQRGTKTLIDGGVIWNLDVPSAIRRCREVVNSDKDIVVDFILCTNHNIATVTDLRKYKTMDHFMRGRDIKSFYNGMNDYNSSTIMYPDVTFRYIIAPSEDMAIGFLPLDFSRAQVDKCFEIGAKDAKSAVKLGPGGYGKVLLDYIEKVQNHEDAVLSDMIDAKVLELENIKLNSA